MIVKPLNNAVKSITSATLLTQIGGGIDSKSPLKLAILSAATITLLSACGGSGGGGNNNPALNPPANPTAAVADRVVSVRRFGPYSNAGTFLPEGSTVTNEAEAALLLDDSYNITATETQDTFALRRSGNNFVMTVNGTAHTLIRREITPVLRDSNDNSRIITPASYEWSGAASGQLYSYSFSGDLLPVLDGTHATIQGAYIQYSTSSALNGSQIGINLDYTEGYTTVGRRTLPSVVASQTATATYRGRVLLNVQSTFAKTAGQANVSYSVTPSTTEYISGGGVLTMNANFTDNTIAGEVTYGVANLTTGQLIPDRDATITFNSAPIVDNGFAGTFNMNANYRSVEGITNNPTGNYAGNFFGPNADDIAGVMRFGAQGGAIGQGAFRADRQVDPAQ